MRLGYQMPRLIITDIASRLQEAVNNDWVKLVGIVLLFVILRLLDRLIGKRRGGN